jgi:hypothetical protein
MKKDRLRVGELLAYTVLAILVFSDVWISPATRWIGLRKDPQLFLWYLEHLPYSLSHGLNPFFSTYLNWPDGTNLLWNSSVIVPAFLLWPVTALFGPVVAYNTMVTAAVALSAWVASHAARLFVRGRWLAVLVGLIYGFSPGMMAQATGHPHVLIAWFPPLVLIAGYEILIRQRRSPVLVGAAAGVVSTLQLLTGEELLVLTAVVAVLGVALLAAMHLHEVRARLSYAATATLVAAAVFVALCAYPLWLQFFGPQRVIGQLQPADRYVTDLLGFVVPNRNLLQNGLTRDIIGHFTGNRAEDDAYLGIPLLVMFAAAALATWQRPAIRWVSVLTLLAAVLSLGPHLHVNGWVSPLPLPWILVGGLPLFRNIVPARLMLLAILGVALAVAVLLEQSRSGTVWQRRSAFIGTALALLFIVPEIPFVSTPAAAPSFFTTASDVDRIPAGSVALITPFADANSADAMYWQALANFRFHMPEGDAFSAGPFLGPTPSDLGTTLDHLDSGTPVSLTGDARGSALRDLARWHVQTIIVGPSVGHDAIVSYLSSVLGVPPQSVDGVDVWWNCCPAPASP